MANPPQLLLIDDEQTIGVIAGHLSRRANHQLTHCRDAPEAWDWLHQAIELPDLVLLDVKLPGTSGLELHQRLMEKERFRNLRVALLSQSTLPEVLAQALRQRIDFYVAKDLLSDPGAWTERIQDVLGTPREISPPSEADSMDREDLLARIEQIVARTELRSLGAEVIGALRARAREQALDDQTAHHVKIQAWTDSEWLPLPTSPESAQFRQSLFPRIRAFLCHQLKCLLGTKQSAPLLTILNSPRQ